MIEIYEAVSVLYGHTTSHGVFLKEAEAARHLEQAAAGFFGPIDAKASCAVLTRTLTDSDGFHVSPDAPSTPPGHVPCRGDEMEYDPEVLRCDVADIEEVLERASADELKQKLRDDMQPSQELGFRG